MFEVQQKSQTGYAQMPLQVPPPILGYRHHPLEYFLTYDGFMYNEPQVSFPDHISVGSFQVVPHLFVPRPCQKRFCAKLRGGLLPHRAAVVTVEKLKMVFLAVHRT